MLTMYPMVIDVNNVSEMMSWFYLLIYFVPQSSLKISTLVTLQLHIKKRIPAMNSVQYDV